MRTSAKALLMSLVAVATLVAVAVVDHQWELNKDFHAIRNFQYHSRAQHGRKILFNSHTLNTEIVPNVRGNVERYSISGLTHKVATMFQPSSLEGTPRRIYLVQFKGDVTQAIKDAFKAAVGVELGPYIPHNSFALVATEAQMHGTVDLPDVAWAGEFPEDAKLTGPLLDFVQGAVESLPEGAGLHEGMNLDVRLAPEPRTTHELAEIVARWQVRLEETMPDVTVSVMESRRNDRIHIKRVGATAPADVLGVVKPLLGFADCFGVQLMLRKTSTNQYAQWITQTNDDTQPNRGRSLWARGLDGTGQLIGVADSGLDFDHCMFRGLPNSNPAAPPFGSTSTGPTMDLSRRKVVGYQDISDRDDDSGGHGTHVCGTIAGFVNLANYPAVLNQHSGLAPGAQIAFSDIETSGSRHFDGLDGRDFPTAILNWAYGGPNGARIHSDSWGTKDNSYDSDAASLDDFLYEHPLMTVLVAAGNNGGDPGVVSNSVGSPATAKNAITVGSANTANAGMMDSLKFIDWDANIVYARNALDDQSLNCCAESSSQIVKEFCCESYRTNQIITNARNEFSQNSLSYFSSRGPTRDGRFKPDLLGIGASIVSANSDGCVGSGCTDRCAGSYNNMTIFQPKDGTSMATPGVAGSAAIVRQYFTQGWFPSGGPNIADEVTPSGALIGAMLMNSGRSLTGSVDRDNQGHYVSLADGTFPLDIYQGFGRIELDNVLWFPSPIVPWQLYFADNLQVSAGADYDMSLDVTGPGIVRVNMGYRDPAGSPSSASATVNDLDLYVGTFLNGTNTWAGNFKTQRDPRNNNEGVPYVVTGIGRIYIKVRGMNVPQGPQTFALVVTGPISYSTAAVVTAGSYVVPAFAEFGSDSGSEDKSGMVAGVVIGIIVVCCIVAAIWYYVVYLPNNRRRAAAANSRYQQQHAQPQQPVPMTGVPVSGGPVMGVPVHQPPQQVGGGVG